MPRINKLMGAGTPGVQARAIVGAVGTVTAAGTGQSTATLLENEVNAVSAAASADGVVLPTVAQGSQVGDTIDVYTTSSTTGKVYPGGAETANGSASAVSVAQNKLAHFVRITATNWGYFVTA